MIINIVRATYIELLLSVMFSPVFLLSGSSRYAERLLTRTEWIGARRFAKRSV